MTAWHNKEFPDELKVMDVTKIYKKDDPNKSKNHRRVSVLFVFSKDLGITLRDHMSQYVSYIITPYLCGYRQDLLLNRHSCFIEKRKFALNSKGYGFALLVAPLKVSAVSVLSVS